ncbi:MAG: OmpH family outer membrane protein [Nitrospirae bacterium]|nr:OmpH family outer membrane protein [Nitrospirota bacterium]
MRISFFKKFCILSFLLFVIYCLPISSIASDQVKIGVIDIQKVLNESEEGKKAKSNLETLIRSKQSIIDEKGKAIEKLKSEIEKQSSVLSADARKNKEEELEKLIREYQRTVQDSQAEIKKKESDLTDIILREIQEIVSKIGETEGYTLIIEKGMIIFSNKNIDITDTILKKYNESKAKKKE